MARSRLMTKVLSGSVSLTLPHQMSLTEASLSTTRLSLGLRPVFLPESATSAPVEAMAVSGS